MPERQCHGCRNQEAWGCQGKSFPTTEDDPFAEWDGGTESWVRWVNGAEHPLEIGGLDTRACPRQHIHENPAFWSRLLLFYGMYSKGHLPERGAVLDQSHRLLHLFRILDNANAECDAEQNKPERPKGDPSKRTQ